MTTFYEDMQAIASSVIEEFAQGTVRYVTKTRVAGGTPDAPAASTETATAINAVVKPVSTKYVDGTHIVSTDEEIIIPGNAVVPTMDGWVTVDGVRLKIVKIMRIPAAGTVVSYILLVRR